MEHPILTELNKNSLTHEKVEVLNADGYNYILEDEDFYDVIIIDLPDPRTVELGRLYSYEFYRSCYKRLRVITSYSIHYTKLYEPASFMVSFIHKKDRVAKYGLPP